MVEAMHHKIRESMESAEGLYYRLVLLTGKSGSGKTRVLRDMAEEYKTTILNINLLLSGRLLELSEKQRTLRLPGILEEIIRSEEHNNDDRHRGAGTPLILDNTEILFDKNLKQNPLRLLQSISRNRLILASWNGTLVRGKLQYAEIGHPEYQSYDSDDILIVDMEAGAKKDLPAGDRS
ncbi:hypothetical protein LZ24_01191 [Desulfobotulus alkaliphilus]|uniref:ATPase family protein associated with various cellular activities (AAA) n=1 Tax=Desulfobotulus alkaliphilus TaxID=622671 RepID=A0A562RY40_9BACT|nr:BREX-3 system P-loop-containing protein BrxF [Desulfobotulus alkaliphilus]TWI73961.1 hypothetical protein LZ24_01191 [Desulfobotulus alkaliphilus]